MLTGALIVEISNCTSLNRFLWGARSKLYVENRAATINKTQVVPARDSLTVLAAEKT